MGTKLTYSLKKIRRHYTYAVSEIAELYKLTPDTVFRWIREDGLKRIQGSKKYFVHGGDLEIFIKKRNSRNKHPCQAGEMYCCKCRQPRKPETISLSIKNLPNKTIRVKGLCMICNTGMNTIVSGKKWTKSHPFYPHTDVPTTHHSGEHISPRECQSRRGEPQCLNTTL